jgi:hypothetical protein
LILGTARKKKKTTTIELLKIDLKDSITTTKKCYAS